MTTSKQAAPAGKQERKVVDAYLAFGEDENFLLVLVFNDGKLAVQDIDASDFQAWGNEGLLVR